MRYQNKIDLLTKEIKNAKYKNGLLEILNLDLNKFDFELKERKSNQFILNKIYDNRNLINNNMENNNFSNNNNQNGIDRFKSQLPIKHFNNNYQQNFNNQEIINLRNELNNKNKIIEKQKIQINNLKNQLNDINNNNKLSIQNLQNNINVKDQEIFNLKNKIEELNKFKLNNNKLPNMIDIEQTLAINFMSVRHDKILPITCLKNETLVKYEEIFYNEYPEYKEYNTYLTANGKQIKRFKTLKENGIKQGSAIIVNIYE